MSSALTLIEAGHFVAFLLLTCNIFATNNRSPAAVSPTIHYGSAPHILFIYWFFTSLIWFCRVFGSVLRNNMSIDCVICVLIVHVWCGWICRATEMANRGRRSGAVCSSSPLAPGNLHWISAVSTAYVVVYLPCFFFVEMWILFVLIEE